MPSSRPSSDPDRAEPSAQVPFRELSRTFWRGMSSTHGLGDAIEEVLREFNGHVGAKRTSVWLHDRRARELSLVASSDRAYRATAPRVLIANADAPAARGLRLEFPELLADRPEPVLISPLRGWRRALGTLVIESPFSPDLEAWQQVDLANELGRQLSVGIENVQLLEGMLRQRRLLEDTFNSLIDLVVVTDRAQRVVQMNDAFATRLGLSRTELLDQQLGDLVGSELAQWAAAAEADTGHDRSEEVGRARTIEHPRLGGIFNLTVTPLINEDGEPVGTVLVARDITRQTALEAEKAALHAQLAQSEKLASLGQFVAGIAHEINNPLQGVLGHLELLLWTKASKASASPDAMRSVRKELRRIYHEADRAAKIVRNLLTFSGGSHRMTRRRLRLDRVVTRALGSRRTALHRAKIEIVRTQTDDVPSILGDQLLLQQAFVNVIANAEQAIAETGTPGTIAVAITSPDPDTVRMTISDTGRGIPPEVLPRIFDPFFTTKEVGKGTGLGLTLAYGVIQEHGGTIQAANGESGGAVFTIDLPAADPRVPSNART